LIGPPVKMAAILAEVLSNCQTDAGARSVARLKI
jgi:hypothetical protein